MFKNRGRKGIDPPSHFILNYVVLKQMNYGIWKSPRSALSKFADKTGDCVKQCFLRSISSSYHINNIKLKLNPRVHRRLKPSPRLKYIFELFELKATCTDMRFVLFLRQIYKSYFNVRIELRSKPCPKRTEMLYNTVYSSILLLSTQLDLGSKKMPFICQLIMRHFKMKQIHRKSFKKGGKFWAWFPAGLATVCPVIKVKEEGTDDEAPLIWIGLNHFE